MKTIICKFAFTASMDRHIGLSLLIASAFAFFGCSDCGDGGLGDSSSSSDDGRVYESVSIGSQVWMKKNLDIEADWSKCYDDDPANCAKYGRLYNWDAAKTICPGGWHLPDTAEWNRLARFIEADKNCAQCDAKHLKAASGWVNYGNGEDSYEFAALPNGWSFSYGDFHSIGYESSWWSATEGSDGGAYYWSMYYDNDYNRERNVFKSILNGVRCIKD